MSSVAIQFQIVTEVPGPLDTRLAGPASDTIDFKYSGLLRYVTDTGQFVVWDGSNWVTLASKLQITNSGGVFNHSAVHTGVGQGKGIFLIDGAIQEGIPTIAVGQVWDTTESTPATYVPPDYMTTPFHVDYFGNTEANSLVVGKPYVPNYDNNMSLVYLHQGFTVGGDTRGGKLRVRDLFTVGETTHGLYRYQANGGYYNTATSELEVRQQIIDTEPFRILTSSQHAGNAEVGVWDPATQSTTAGAAPDYTSQVEVQIRGLLTAGHPTGGTYSVLNGTHPSWNTPFFRVNEDYMAMGAGSLGGGVGTQITNAALLIGQDGKIQTEGNLECGTVQCSTIACTGLTADGDITITGDLQCNTVDTNYIDVHNAAFRAGSSGILVGTSGNRAGNAKCEIRASDGYIGTDSLIWTANGLETDGHINAYGSLFIGTGGTNGSSSNTRGGGVKCFIRASDGYIGTDGDIRAGGLIYENGGGQHVSDDNLKSSTESINDALGVLNQLKPCKYVKHPSLYTASESPDLTGHEHYIEIGLIAQDVEKIDYLKHTVRELPESSDAIKTLNYTQFTPLLIRGVQELHAENAALRASLGALTARIDALEAGASTGVAESVSVQ